MATDTQWRCTVNLPPGKFEDGRSIQVRDGGRVTTGTFRLDWQDDETAWSNVVLGDGSVCPLGAWVEWRPYEEDRER